MTEMFQCGVMVLAALVALPLAYGFWKKALIATTVVINRQTDDGESLTIQASFPKSMTLEDRQAEIQKLFSHTDERKKFTHERFMALLEAERAKQAGQSGLKSV
jgi:hypothetical protein